MYVCMTHKRAVYAQRIIKTFEYQQQSADDCLRIFVYGNMNSSAGLSDAYTTLFRDVLSWCGTSVGPSLNPNSLC